MRLSPVFLSLVIVAGGIHAASAQNPEQPSGKSTLGGPPVVYRGERPVRPPTTRSLRRYYRRVPDGQPQSRPPRELSKRQAFAWCQKSHGARFIGVFRRADGRFMCRHCDTGFRAKKGRCHPAR